MLRKTDFVLCSDCFQDQGLRLDAAQIGFSKASDCPNCGAKTGRKLTKDLIAKLANRFFVWGTIQRLKYGAAPVVQFNDRQSTNINTPPGLEPDLRLIENAIGVGFFYYGPRMWMVGEVEPLKALQDPATRAPIVARILAEYPTISLTTGQTFYRIRKSPANPTESHEYDSPPIALAGTGRFDSKGAPMMYGSQDLHVCVHECRVTAEDNLFVATLTPTRDLRILNLTELLHEEDTTEFESLDMAVHMLFLAGEHSYDITRELALAAQTSGYDGFVYPSYFSLLRTGQMPYRTVYGISTRRIPQFAEIEKSMSIPNLALFGRPIEQGCVSVRCINKLILNQVAYGFHFGPVGY